MATPAILRAANAGAALLLALCAGAVWSVVSLFFRGDASWMSIPTALVVAHAVGYPKLASGLARAALALGLYVAAVSYAHYLDGASAVSAQLGIAFLDALRAVGPEMAWALASARVEPWEWSLIAIVGVALAGWAWASTRRSR